MWWRVERMMTRRRRMTRSRRSGMIGGSGRSGRIGGSGMIGGKGGKSDGRSDGRIGRSDGRSGRSDGRSGRSDVSCCWRPSPSLSRCLSPTLRWWRETTWARRRAPREEQEHPGVGLV